MRIFLAPGHGVRRPFYRYRQYMRTRLILTASVLGLAALVSGCATTGSNLTDELARSNDGTF